MRSSAPEATPEESFSEARPRPPRRKATGLIAVALVAVSAAVAQAFGRFTFGVLLPAIRDDLGVSNTVAGFLTTLNVAAYLVGTVAVAVATSRYRLLAVMRVGLVLSTIGLILAAASTGPLLLGVSMLFSGVGGACTWIPAPVIAAGAMAPEKRSIAIGLMSSGIGAGVVFSGQLSGFVRSTMGDAAWRNVYAVQAVIAVVVLILTLLFIGHRQDRPTSKAGIGGFGALQRMNGWVPLTLAYTSFGLMYLLVIGFLTTRLEDDSNWTSGEASLAFTVMGVAMMFGGPTFLAIGGRVGSRIALSGCFALWILAALSILPGWFIPTLAVSAVLGMLFSGIPSTITLYVVNNTTSDDYGPSFAAATLAFGVAQTVSPQFGGFIADLSGSFTLVFMLSSVFAATGLVAALRLPRQRNPPHRRTHEPVTELPDGWPEPANLVFELSLAATRDSDSAAGPGS
ncbi:MAG: putative MFS family arabinose efflux permease [Candidatus Poriferisodalaceae bacterium]|jgi:predicted MFS family arabinose efflux permease